MQRKRLVFPFSAIVGLNKLKLAILINAINPKVGGLLIRGAKGSGKNTIVRALADILPKIKVVKVVRLTATAPTHPKCAPKCSGKYKNGEKLPVEEREMVVVDLPLGATEDRVVGTLDVEKAIKYGIEALELGILAEANQNILYVDEVNLLPDHIADDLLDVAATGARSINTNPHMYGRETYGFLVTKSIASITNGNHHVIGRLTTKENMIEEVIERIREDQQKIIF